MVDSETCSARSKITSTAASGVASILREKLITTCSSRVEDIESKTPITYQE